MKPRPMNYPVCIAARLTVDDNRKLQALCAETDRTPGEVLRLLVRLVQPTGQPQMVMPALDGVVPQVGAR